MVIPLIVLAIGAALAGFLGAPEGLSGGRIPNYFERLLEPSIARSAEAGHAPERAAEIDILRPPLRSQSAQQLASEPAANEDHGLEFKLTLVSSIIALLGIGLGWVWFKRKPLWQPPSLLEHKYYVDEAYDAAVIQPIKVGSINVLWKFIDVHVIDGAVNGAGHAARLCGGGLRYLQSGLARSYVAIVVLGALLIIGYFVIK